MSGIWVVEWWGECIKGSVWGRAKMNKKAQFNILLIVMFLLMVVLLIWLIMKRLGS